MLHGKESVVVVIIVVVVFRCSIIPLHIQIHVALHFKVHLLLVEIAEIFKRFLVVLVKFRVLYCP